MGQRVHAVMFGSVVNTIPEVFLEDNGLDSVVGEIRRDLSIASGVDYNFDEKSEVGLVGVWIARGAYRYNDVPPLETPLSIEHMRESPTYGLAIANAERDFAKVIEWAREHGVELGEPGLLLTLTEVA